MIKSLRYMFAVWLQYGKNTQTQCCPAIRWSMDGARTMTYKWAVPIQAQSEAWTEAVRLSDNFEINEQEGHDGPVSLHWLIREIHSYQTLHYLGIGLRHKTPYKD